MNTSSGVKYATEDGKLVCFFNGQMDTITSSTIEKELLDKVRSLEAPTVFDFKQVNYVASGFLRICLQVAQQLGKEKFFIINTSPSVKKVLKMSGFNDVITME